RWRSTPAPRRTRARARAAASRATTAAPARTAARPRAAAAPRSTPAAESARARASRPGGRSPPAGFASEAMKAKQTRNRFGFPDLGIGVGLRTAHYGHVLEHKPPVDWFEIISENFIGTHGRPGWVLEQVAERY